MLTVQVPNSYHLTQCGLSYIHLLDGYRLDAAKGKSTVHIVGMDALYKTLAEHVLCKPEQLNGEELMFLLKRINGSEADFCELLKIQTVQLNNWKKRSHHALMPLVTEVTARMLLGEMLGCWRLVSDILEGLHDSMKKPYLAPDILFLRRSDDGWEVARGS
ncbi:MAG: hypothetical protein DI628_06660 [Blastochloris viridis]|uniref:Uncharacterized protein n=1 Tax=Blastochloris viridis TaxID=1079 RepID=A0A6N4QZ17_BLAVI|nr:MAG: hypothetical protein DI628_06660 [Blastochloris viridis]